MNDENFEKVILFIKENYHWIIPVAIGFAILLLTKVIKFRNVLIQKNSGKGSKNIQIGNDILIYPNKKKSLKDD